MKSYKEVAERVFERRDRYLAEKKRKRAVMLKRASVGLSFCIVLLVGFGMWTNEKIRNSSETFHDNSDGEVIIDMEGNTSATSAVKENTVTATEIYTAETVRTAPETSVFRTTSAETTGGVVQTATPTETAVRYYTTSSTTVSVYVAEITGKPEVTATATLTLTATNPPPVTTQATHTTGTMVFPESTKSEESYETATTQVQPDTTVTVRTTTTTRPHINTTDDGGHTTRTTTTTGYFHDFTTETQTYPMHTAETTTTTTTTATSAGQTAEIFQTLTTMSYQTTEFHDTTTFTTTVTEQTTPTYEYNYTDTTTFYYYDDYSEY